MITAPVASTNPVAGVMTTSPATAPEQKPMTDACFLKMNSSAPQVKDATAVARVVVMKALAAMPSAPTAEPALNPYHPTQSIPVPIMQRTRSEEHTSELQSLRHLVCRLLLEKTNT